MSNSDRDVVIVGGGIGGMTAGVYASRAGLRTVLYERLMPGGQIINAEKIENLPGLPDGISGPDLSAALQEQASKYGLDVEYAEVNGLESNDSDWTVHAGDESVTANAVIVSGGSTLRKLGVPGEEGLHGAGVSYCATCDGPFFMDEVVGVVGGGDSALDETLALTEFASKVIVFHRRAEFRAQKLLQDRVLSHPKVEARWNTVVDEVLGDDLVEGVGTTEVVTGETSRVDLSGIFIYVGLEPNTQILDGVLDTDAAGHIPTDIWMRTSLRGLLAAGDIRQHSSAQLASAAGDGATAAIAAQRYIESGYWPDQLA